MRRKQRPGAVWMWPAALLLLAVVLTGVSTAHYSQRMEYTRAVQQRGEGGQVCLLSAREGAEQAGSYPRLEPGEWTQADAWGGGQRLDFLLANGENGENWCDYDQSVRLTVFVTAGVGNGSLAVTLSASGSEYEGQAEEILEGSDLYKRYGAGWLFRFYDSDGEETDWYLSGGNFFCRRMALTVLGAPECTAAVSLLAEGYPAA